RRLPRGMSTVGGSRNCIVRNDRGSFVRRWPRRLRSISRSGVRYVKYALIFIFVFVLARPIAQDAPNIVAIRARRAQEFIDQLRAALAIRNEIQIAVVAHHPLVFSVEPADIHKNRFLLTMELGFLLMLDENELRAAIAHELGHVWIYTHHPFLQ